ncbi:MAG: ATP-binding cassette domain-containing protein [Mycobacterium sp.]|nr:ATP-binding cassette domain-containing protein [Mycobacterium sp.]
MPSEAFASPVIVWLGPNRYTFPVGRDVTIGRDSRADIRVDGAGTSSSPTHVVLHHNGRQWIAVDRGEGGIYVDGVRMSTVFIHDGKAITLGDPQHGPRLVFRLGAPPPPPPPRSIAPPRPAPRGAPRPELRPAPPGMRAVPPPQIRPAPPPQIRPAPPPPAATHRGPGQAGWAPPTPPPLRADQAKRPPIPPPPAVPAPSGPHRAAPTTRSDQLVPPTAQFHPPAPNPAPWPTQPPPPPVPQPLPAQPPPQAQPGPVPALPSAPRKRKAFVEALTGAMQKLRPQRPEPRPHEAAPTTALPRPDVPETQTAEAPSPQPMLKPGRLEARQVRLTVDGEQVLAELSFTAEPGTLTAVIGASEVSTAALVDVLGGTVQPSVGAVHFDSHDVAADHVRRHVGVVPRFDLLHPALTVEQALGYAAELRLPPSTSADSRRQKVGWALDEMKLSLLRTVQVGKLTAEQRKRGSMAMELLTNPSLLVLDEPTAGLDPDAESEMTATLRRLADEGRVVVVATTSPTDIGNCDQVVLLTGTGTPAFAGPPAQIGAELGTTNWTEILERVNTDPYGAHDAYLAQLPEALPDAEPPQGPVEPAARLHLWRQIVIAVRRQGWLMVGDQRYFILLTILPVLFGAITLLVPGDAGLGPANPYGNSPDEAVEVLAVLVIGAVVMGTALGIRDLFGEARIFRREQVNGLSASAFLAGKIVVYSLVAVVATAIMLTAAVVGKGAPTHGAVLLGHGTFQATVELFVVLAITTIVSAMVALALSSLASYSEQILLMAVLVVLFSVVFAGAIFPIDGRFGLEQISWLVPSRWGFAASASTVDVHAVNLLAASDDSWKHSTGRWLVDMGALVGLGAVATASLRWRLRRPALRH